MVATLLGYDSLFGSLAVLQLVFFKEGVYSLEILHRVLAHIEVVQQFAELGIILSALNLARHVGPLQILDGLDDAIKILLLLKVDLLFRSEFEDLL